MRTLCRGPAQPAAEIVELLEIVEGDADLAGAGLKISEDRVCGKMDEFLAAARKEIQAGG